jgi:hypothetical protein
MRWGLFFEYAEGGESPVIPEIIVVDDGDQWSNPTTFDPSAVPRSARIEPYDVERHWQRIGYFLMTEDGHLIVDGVGIKAHLVLAKTYWFLKNGRTWDEEGFKRFNATIAHGGIWPPILILMSSRTYPNHISADTLRGIIGRFAPRGELTFQTGAIYFDFGRLSEKVEHEVRRIAAE